MATDIVLIGLEGHQSVMLRALPSLPEARLAAVKVNLAAGYAEAEAAMTPPGASVQDRTVRRMSMTAEVAGALTVSEGAAERLLVDSAKLTKDLPLALGALASLPPEASIVPSGESASERTAAVWPENVRTLMPSLTRQKRMALSR